MVRAHHMKDLVRRRDGVVWKLDDQSPVVRSADKNTNTISSHEDLLITDLEV